MFALLLPGRPLIPAEAINPTQYMFKFPASPPFTHLAIFLLPDSNLPVDTGASIWLQTGATGDFRFLGALAAAKPSAIYRINHPAVNQGINARTDGEGDVMLDEDTALPAAIGNGAQAEIVIGVQIASAAEIQAQLDQHKAKGPSSAVANAGGAGAKGPVETKVLAQRIIGNAFNFLSSFGSDTIPLKAFQEWWKKFEGKIERDPSFLEREQG